MLPIPGLPERDTLRVLEVWLIPVVAIAVLYLVNAIYRRTRPEEAQRHAKKVHKTAYNPFRWQPSSRMDTGGSLVRLWASPSTLAPDVDLSGWYNLAMILAATWLFGVTIRSAKETGSIPGLQTAIDAFAAVGERSRGHWQQWVEGACTRLAVLPLPACRVTVSLQASWGSRSPSCWHATASARSRSSTPSRWATCTR